MSSWVIAGASRGLGFEFVRQLSANPKNTVIGIVRNVEAATEKVAAELQDRKNVHMIYGDMDKYETLQTAAAETAKITGGPLDHLVANAASMGTTFPLPINDLASDPALLESDTLSLVKTNALAPAALFAAYLPLIQKGTAKKVFAISTAMGDPDLVRGDDVWMGVAYAASKAALNIMVAKYSAQFADEGVLFMAISPGFVDTNPADPDAPLPPEIAAKAITAMVTKFHEYAPRWKRALTPAESVELVLSVMERSSVEHGDGGSFVSQFGNKQWL